MFRPISFLALFLVCSASACTSDPDLATEGGVPEASAPEGGADAAADGAEADEDAGNADGSEAGQPEGSAPDGAPEGGEPSWTRIEKSPGASLMAVHGTSANDVWMAGADDGTGPLVLHWDGAHWDKRATFAQGDIWWAHAIPGGPVFFAGANANILRYDGTSFERMTTPGLGKDIVYGLWAAGASDVYAVGSSAGRNGFIWHYDGRSWQSIALPADLPEDSYHDIAPFFKVWGASPTDVWVVGGRGLVLRGSASDGFHQVPSGTAATLLTVYAAAGRVVIVGGDGTGVILELEGDTLVDRSPANAPLLQGAFVAADGTAWVSGVGGSIYRSSAGADGGTGYVAVDPGTDFTNTQSLHATWGDPSGGLWAVGGNVLYAPLVSGIALHRGAAVDTINVDQPPPPPVVCPNDAIDPAPSGSIARRWNEQILNAIRRDTPRPTVHARNLLHLSIAMWDAWAAYDATADGFLVHERQSASDLDAARSEAISYAAYRVLSHRYAGATGGSISQACFDSFMEKLGLDAADTTTDGDSPRALGNRIGAAVIAAYADDGANEANNYAAPDPYVADNPNLAVDVPGTTVNNPLHWQKLVLAQAVTQNGISLGSGVQDYIGAQWGQVIPFAIQRPADGQPYLDIGTPPIMLSSDLVDASVEIIRKSSQLDTEDGATIDISPGAYGNNSLGANDGQGRPVNPVTAAPYAPEVVNTGDFTRVLAEFWADGPKSETPPGHWNTIANAVADHPMTKKQLFGTGPILDPLSWDVHVYLALNGALHDAAIAAWELKRVYTSARPITLIRYMGGLGQRTDSTLPSYDPDGLPLIPNLIEVITPESSAPGQRHAHLARYVGEIAVRSWRGEPGDRAHEIGGVDWVRAIEWIPYQRRTFVTPAFPGYLSGHSSFSRSAATVLARLTGSDYFPGGLGSYAFDPGYLTFEKGPTAHVELQWATYYDAADQAGQSRLFGGIHIRMDDFDGRRVGARVGAAAIDKATSYFDGTAVP